MEIKEAIPYDSRESLIKDFVNTNTNTKSRNRTRTFQYNDKDYNGKVAIEVNLPITIKVNPKEQSVTYELDKVVLEARNSLDLQQEQEEGERKQKKKKQEHESKNQQLQEQQKVETKRCVICEQPGLRYQVELMPQDGILWGTKHDDGKICKWFVTYRSHLNRSERTSKTIEDCPVCHKRGRINDDFLDEEGNHDNMQYVITHVGKKGGCHISKQEDRDVILKELGRYIEPPAEIRQVL